MKTIPLNSLVLLIKPLGCSFPKEINEQFSDHEILSIEKIRYDIIGDSKRKDINNYAYKELYEKIDIKLKLGERVVVSSSLLKSNDRKEINEIAHKYGISIFYLIYNESLEYKLSNNTISSSIVETQEKIFNENEWQILRGDNVAEIIDLRFRKFSCINKIQKNHNIIDLIKLKNKNGLTVVGDIHGSLDSLKSAINWAKSRNHFLLFLGDIIDYGPKPVECIDLIYETMIRGECCMVLGNHEIKIKNYLLSQNNINLSEGNIITINKINELTEYQKSCWIHRFLTVFSYSRNHWIGQNVLFTHAAAEPEMFLMNSHRLSSKNNLSKMATFGEISNEKRSESWIDRIPSNKIVIVGHTIQDYYHPKTINTNNNSKVVFLDTGCGKGGSLSSCDLKIKNGNLEIKNFNKH